MPYGGRREIADAVRSLLQEHAERGTSLEELAEVIDVDHIAEHLYTKGQPDPDLVIRTSGEQRLGGFLLWQSAQSEFYFCEAYWPDFRKVDFLRAMRAYASASAGTAASPTRDSLTPAFARVARCFPGSARRSFASIGGEGKPRRIGRPVRERSRPDTAAASAAPPGGHAACGRSALRPSGSFPVHRAEPVGPGEECPRGP